jgi:hypothetical protein
MRKKRMNYLPTKNGREQAAFDVPFGDNIPSDSAPSPEEHFDLLSTLKLLKGNLPDESYELIEKEFIPKLDKFIVPSSKKHEVEDANKYSIWTIFSDLPENEIKILHQIAEFFVNVLGFQKEQVLYRTKTIDIFLD